MQARDFADVTAELLQAQKRKLDESQAHYQSEFEAREARFNADLDSIAPHQSKDSTKPAQSEGFWMLARKSWVWLYGDK